MIKKVTYIVFFLLIACNSESASDCFQTGGKTIQREFEVPIFSKILVNENVEMVLAQGNEQRVIIETGENLLNDIEVDVISSQLIISDNNSCNYFRSYNTTKVFVTAPDINEIRSSTQYDITSEGVLTYPDLTIYSEDYREEFQTTGNFYLELENESLTVVFNNLSNCFISGNTDALNINYASGDGRFEGENFVATNVNIYHRGSNDIIIHPVNELTGNLFGTGDLISVNTPENINVTEHYRGKLIFRN